MSRLRSSWTNTLAKLGFERKISRERRRQRHSSFGRRLRLESLESRVLLAADYVVTTLDDIPIDLSDSQWSLREALQAAANDGQNDVDSIEFAPNLWGDTLQLTQGQLLINSDVDIVGPGQDLLTIDAHGSSRVLKIDSGAQVSLSGVKLTGGEASGYGGGVNIVSGHLITDSIVVTGNHATIHGGGIFVSGEGSFDLSNSTIYDNTANAFGGGIYGSNTNVQITTSTIADNHGIRGGGLYIKNSNTVISSSTFDENTAGYVGGAVAFEEGVILITDSVLADNQSSHAGAIHAIINNDAHFTIDHSTLRGNVASNEQLDGNSGALEVYGSPAAAPGTMTIRDSHLDSNYAQRYGGAVFQLLGTLDISGSTFVNNEASPANGGYGGALQLSFSSDLTVSINDSTFSGNRANHGGALNIVGNTSTGDGRTTIVNSTFTKNEASGSISADGGAIRLTQGSVILKNSILAGNIAGNTSTSDGTGNLGGTALDASSYNLIGVGNASLNLDPVDHNQLGTQAVPIDPKLAPLSDYGGPTPTHALMPDSPAIDAGSNANISAGVTKDQRGFARTVDVGAISPTGQTVDVGAFELSKVVLLGDFNGDGIDDGVSFDSTTSRIVVDLGGDVDSRTAEWATLGSGLWNTFRVGDFNGDGRDDLAFRSTSAWYFAISDSTRFYVTAVPIATSWVLDQTTVGEFDADGSDELLGWNSSSGKWQVLHFDERTGTRLDTDWGSQVHSLIDPGILHVGDANRDGRDDLVIRNTAGDWIVSLSQSTNGGTFAIPSNWGHWFTPYSNTEGTEVDIDAPYQAVLDIFSEVRNTVELDFYPGLMKGIEATAETKMGNDWDQAALLVDRLEAAGFDADIASGQVTITPDAAQKWVGAKTWQAAYAVIQGALDGNSMLIDNGPSYDLRFKHAWVRIKVPTASGFAFVDVDPSWKFKDRQAGISLSGLSSPQGIFDEFAYLSQSGNQLPIEFFEDQVAQYLANQGINASLADVPFDGPILQQQYSTIPVGLGEGVTTFGTVATYPSFQAIVDNTTWRNQLTHGATISLEREIVSDARTTGVGGSINFGLLPELLPTNSKNVNAATANYQNWTGLDTTHGSVSQTTNSNGTPVIELRGTQFVVVQIPSGYSLSDNTRLQFEFEGNGASNVARLIGLDPNSTYNNAPGEYAASIDSFYTPGSGVKQVDISIGELYRDQTTATANWIVLGMQRTDTGFVPTTTYARYGKFVLYEPGTTTLIDGGTTIRQVGATQAELAIDVAEETGNQPYALTRNTILEFEFRSGSEGRLHAVGWDVDFDSTNDSGQLSKRQQLHGTGTQSGYLTTYNNYSGSDWVSYSIPIASALPSTTTYDLVRLVFVTDAGTNLNAESQFRNIRFRENAGTDGTHWSQHLVIPSVNLDSINITYDAQENVPEIAVDDTSRSQLLINGAVVQQGASNQFFLPGDNVKIHIDHQSPSEFGISTSAGIGDRTYTREPGQILAINFDANQYSRQHIIGLQSGLNDLLLDGDDVSDIDDLLSYAGAKYWYEFNRSNRVADGLLHTIGTQQWVGSGIVTADPFLLEIPDEAVAHLQFPIVPHDMGVDLPNVTHASYDATTGEIGTEAFQLMGYNSSALENAILEDVINSESISTIRGLQRAFDDIRGLRFDDSTISREAVQVFESVPNGSSRTVYFRGEIGENVATPYVADRTNMPRTRQQLLDSETGGLKNHVKEANSIADILENVSGQATGNIRVLVPRSRAELGDWTGTVYVAEYETADGRVGSYIISPDGGTPTEGGYSGNVVAPKNLQLPEASFRNQTYAGDPVNVANGNMFRDEVDFRFANRDVPLDFSRHYDSQNNMDVGFGVGWTHSFTGVLYREPGETDDNKIVWLRADGQRHTFERPNASAEYEVPTSLHGSFETILDGGVTFYVYRENDGTQYWFEGASFDDSGIDGHVVGRLAYVAARNDDGVSIGYASATSLRVSRVEDYLTYQRHLEIQYTPISALVKQYDDSQLLSTWQYNFAFVSGGSGHTTRRLTSVTSGTDQFVTVPAIVQYQYYTDGPTARVGLIKKIIEPNGESHEYEYYANGRVFQVTDGEGHQQTFSYNLFRNLTEFTDERGNVETYLHQDNGLLERQIHADRSRMTFTWGTPDTHEESLMKSSSDEVGATETFTYYQPTDSDYRPGELKRSVSKDGIATDYEYWVSSNPNYAHISELSKITVVDPNGPDLVTQYTDRDERGMLKRMEDAAGNVTEREYFGYDTQTTPVHLLGRLKSETQPKGVEGDEAVTWQPLADEFTVTGDTLTVRLLAPNTEVGNKRVIADAIRIDRVDDDAVLTRIIDDDQSGTSPFFRIVATGGVGSSTTPTQPKYEGDATSLLGTASEDRSASWIFTDLLPGTYRVSAVWTWYSDRDSAAHYELFDGFADGGNSDLTADVDQTVPPEGFHSYQTVFDYDTAGNVISAVTEGLPSGTQTYDSYGNVVFAVDATGAGTTNVYDVLGRLIRSSVSSAASPSLPAVSTTVYQYDPSGRLLSSTDAVGRTTTNEFDAKGDLTKQTYADGTSVEFEYDEIGNQAAATDQLGRTTRFIYDSRNRLIQTNFADGTTTRKRYDGAGRVIASFDELGRATAFTYDKAGRVTLKVEYARAAGTSSFNFDDSEIYNFSPSFFGSGPGNGAAESIEGGITLHMEEDVWAGIDLAAVISPDTVLEFDFEAINDGLLQGIGFAQELNQTVEVFPLLLGTGHAGAVWPSSAQLITSAFADYLIGEGPRHFVIPVGQYLEGSSYNYLVFINDDDATDFINPLSGFDVESYFSNVKIAKSVTPSAYDPYGTLPITLGNLYDSLGRLSEQADANHNKTSYKYDALGRVVETRVLDNGSATLPPMFLSTTSYDANGNVAAQVVYDVPGLIRPISEGGAGLSTIPFPSDPTPLIDSYPEFVHKVNTRYDAFGRPVETTTADGTSTSTIYDAAGRVRYGVDELGRRTERQYDEFGRLERTIAPDPDGAGPQESSATRYERDAYGNVTHEWQYFGTYEGVANVEHDNRYVYDSRNRLVTTFMKDDAHRTDMMYDAAGRRIATTDALGNTSYTLLDERGRVLQERLADPDGIGKQFAPVTTYEYDAVGNVTMSRDALGSETRFSYDSLNRLREEFTQHSEIADDSESTSPAFTPDANAQYYTDDITAMVGRDVTWWELGSSQTATWTFDNLQGGDYRVSMTWLPGAEYDDNATVKIRVNGTLVLSTALDQRQNPNDFRSVHGNYDIGWKIVDESVLISNGQTITVELSGTGSDYLNADAVRLDLWVPRSYSYDKNGNLLAATDTLGRTTDFAYDELNRQTSVKLPDPDGAGSLGRRETRSSYDGYGNLIQSVDTRGTPNYDDRTDTFAYDKRNRLVAETLDAGSTGHLNVSTTYEYDAVGNQTLVTDPLGFQAHYRYDAADRLIDEYRDFGDGRTAALQFSSSDITDPYPTYYTGTHELSAGGDELTLEGNAYVLADIGSYAVTHRTVLEFDLQTEDFPELALIGYNDSSLALNRYFELTGSNSYPEYYSTEFRQERLPDSTERFHIPIGQYLTDAEKANGLDITLLEFYNEHLVSDLGDDALPRVTFSNIRLYESDEVRTVTTYDTRGNLETVREASDPRNITTSYRYDILGQQSHEVLDDGGPLQRIFTTTYDAVGNVLVERNHTAGTETRFEYDDLYRLTKTTLPDPDGNPATPNGLVTTFGYDIAGNLIRETNGEAESTYSDYDPQGRVVAEWDGNGDETRYRYDSEGNLRALTDAAQNTTTYAYDALDRVTTETNALDHSRTYVYEKQGNLAKVTDRNGRVREFAYDALDRRLTEKWRATAGGSVVHTLAWDYDDLGRVTQQDDGGVIDTFAYDGLDRLVEQTNYDPAVAPGSSGRPEIRQTYEYSFVYVAGTFVDQLQRDQFVRTTSDEIPLAATISRYDRLGQLVLTVDFDTDSSSPAVVLKLLKFAHDAAGNLQEIDRYGGPTTDLVYDQANRLTSIVHDLATDDITHSYAYDNASRITSFDTTPDNYGIMSRGYTYDEAGQLTDATGPVVEDYAYDANGNRVSAGGQAVVTDAANRVVDDGTYTYQYDIEGNLSGRTLKSNTALTSEYVWDHRNRLTSVTEKNGTTVTQSVDYTYDAQGRRVRRTLDPDGDGTQPATNEYFVYDGSQLAMTFAGSTGGSPVLDHRYLYGPAGQVLVDEVFDAAGDSDEVLWQLADHQGTIRDIVDDNGVVRRHVDYDSFGYILNISWFGYNGGAISPLSPQAVDQLFYYTGQERDDATGLQLHGARWYDPATARWLSEDPIAFDGGDPNLYRYVGNSALNFTDPTGTTQAGNPLSSLPSVSNQSASTFLNQADQYFANQRLSGSLYGSPSQSFTGPTRSATVAPSSDPGLFSTIGSLAYDYVIEPVGSGLTYAGNSIRNKADNLAGRIENVTTTGNTGILGTSLAVYGGLEAHAIRLVGGAAGGVVDVPGTTRAAIDDLRTTKRVYDQYGTATAAARQIGLLQGTEAYYGTDVLTYETVDPFAKLSEASGRFGGTAGTAAGLGAGVSRLLKPKAPSIDPLYRSKIVGTAQKTGTPGHQFRTYREALDAAKNLEVEAVYLNKGYNKALSLEPKTINPNVRPDVTVVYKNRRVGRVEVQSLTDTFEDLTNRNLHLNPQIRAHGYAPLQPNVVIPTTSR